MAIASNPIVDVFRIKDLRERILFTLFILMIFRLGAAIPIPGINLNALKVYFLTQQATGGISVTQYLDFFAGGAFSRFSVFMLGIMPYISMSIIMQLLLLVFPKLKKISEEEGGRKKIQRYTRYGTVASVALDFLPATLFLGDFLQLGENEQQKLHDDRHRDVGHDAEHEHRESAECASRKEVEVLCHRDSAGGLLRQEVHLQRVQVNARDGNCRPEPEDHQDEQRKEDPLAQILDAENVDYGVGCYSHAIPYRRRRRLPRSSPLPVGRLPPGRRPPRQVPRPRLPPGLRRKPFPPQPLSWPGPRQTPADPSR